jgi:hypothetical protein
MLGRFPEVNAMLLDRLSEQMHRMAIAQAVGRLNGVDRRLMALFWHLAERWGRVAPRGVLVPIVISHRMLGALVGARRPTVSTAIGKLVASGELQRMLDGTWLLTGEPVGQPTEQAARVVRSRIPRVGASRALRPTVPHMAEVLATGTSRTSGDLGRTLPRTTSDEHGDSALRASHVERLRPRFASRPSGSGARPS